METLSPPFKGGVAVLIDYLVFTRCFSRPGWLICLLLYTFISMINKNLFNKKGLKSFRSSLRNRSTSAEAALWNILKSKNLDGKKFRRQYSIDNYIVDLCCPSEKLVIELDGAPHGEYYGIYKDEIRVVFQEPEYIKKEIRKVINKKDSKLM